MLFDKNLKKSQSIITSSYLRYILTLDSKNIILSPFRYPCTWYDNLSKIFLIKRFKKKNLLNFIKIYLKEVLLIVSIMSYKTYGPSIKRKNYKNVYITWFKNGDIQKGLLIKDRYINQKFNKKKDIFFSVNMDKNFKKQNLKNTFILTKTGFFQINTLKNLYHLFNYIFFSLINNNLFHSLNVYSFYSYIFFINFKKCFFDCKFENIYMSYEGQPFQNFIISKIKKLFSEVKIIGLVNSFQPFPIHLYNQKNAPHKIIYCHDYIKDHMVNVLNWKKDNFIKKKKNKLNDFKGKILLPFSITDYDKILMILKKLAKSKKIKNLNNLKVQIHPNTPETKKQKILKKKIEKFIRPTRQKYSREVIAIGATSVIMENLIIGNIVYQIYENKEFECLSSKYWPKIKSEYISSNVVKYKLN